jgi:hypothetical protein
MALAGSVKLVWALSILLQLVLFALLFLKGNFRRLPILTAYVFLNLCQAGYLLFLYTDAGASLRSIYFVAWATEAATLLFQALAATEALHLVLKPYPGIWGLGWRLLAFVAALMLAFIAKQTVANHDWNWAMLEADRGYHLLFAAAVIACFLLTRYYSILVPAAYKILLGGFCFFSCTTILMNTVLQSILYRDFAPADRDRIWQLATTLVFALVQAIWVVALRKALPVDERRPAWPSDEIYQQISPVIDQRLQLLNEKLMRIWKSEARSQ